LAGPHTLRSFTSARTIGSDPTRNQWHYAHTRIPREHFDAHYQPDDVRRYFNDRNHFTPGEEISRDEFEKLRIEYEAIAEKNPAPTPLSPRVL
jgi:hypothetical protein